MVEAAVRFDSTREAELWLRKEHPEYDYKTIDWVWLSEVKRYITFDI